MIAQLKIIPLISRSYRFYALISSIIVFLLTLRYFFEFDQTNISPTTSSSSFTSHSYSQTSHSQPSYSQSTTTIPRIIHQTWKTNTPFPTEINRWRKNCINLNQDYQFHLYSHDNIQQFVMDYYPQYIHVFSSLSGVYMADMARVLYTYHYGGIYMDLDYHCYRPLSCLETFIQTKLQTYLSNSLNNHSHILVLSREPPIHAYYIHHKNRTVIQNFFYATPKHPFLGWLLDYVNENYHNHTKINTKGPFSYSLGRYLDYYYQMKNMYLSSTMSLSSLFTIASTSPLSSPLLSQNPTDNQHTYHKLSNISNNSSYNLQPHPPIHSNPPINSLRSSLTNPLTNPANKPHEVIYEMESSIIHPLIDNTNSKIIEGCIHHPIPQFQYECYAIQKGVYMFLVSQTMMVHMWSHLYLTFSYLRSWYDHRTYLHVETSLHPNHSCPLMSYS